LKTKIITVVMLLIFSSIYVSALNKKAFKGLKKHKIKNDDVTIVKYKSKKLPVKDFYAGNETHDYDNTLFYLYIGVKNGNEAFLRMHVQLEPAVDWIKFNKIIITAGDHIFEREFNLARLNSTVALRAQFLEIYDEEVLPHEVDIFEKVGNAEEVTIRFQGANSSQDLKLKNKHIKAIAETVNAWKKLDI